MEIGAELKKKGPVSKQDPTQRGNEMQRMKTQTYPHHKGLKISSRNM